MCHFHYNKRPEVHSKRPEPLQILSTYRKSWKKQLLLSLYHPYKILVYLPVLILSTFFFGTLIVIMVSLGSRKRVHRLPVLWAQCNIKAALCQVRVSGQTHIDHNKSYIIVANHRSHFDVLALYGWLNTSFRWVMKQELRSIPVLGIACEKLGHIYVTRGSTVKSQSSIEEARSKIQQGISIFFFPEGTRSQTPQLLPFKKGAFRLARDMGLPILPITINGSEKILPSKSLNLMPGIIDIVIHPPIQPEEQSERALSDQTKQVISSALSRR